MNTAARSPLNHLWTRRQSRTRAARCSKVKSELRRVSGSVCHRHAAGVGAAVLPCRTCEKLEM